MDNINNDMLYQSALPNLTQRKRQESVNSLQYLLLAKWIRQQDHYSFL